MKTQDNQPVKDIKSYNQYVDEVTPKHKLFPVVLKAFITGGIICTIGQFISSIYKGTGMDIDTAAAWTTLTLILISIILTGLNIYPSIVKFGGAGALVPITGFANSVVSPAIEYKPEGHVFGIGCKVFTIAGPVILFGILVSWAAGIIYFILMRMGIVI